MKPYDNGTALSVLGLSGNAHGRRAVRWLAARSVASFVRTQDRSLNAFAIKSGTQATCDLLESALKATRAT